MPSIFNEVRMLHISGASYGPDSDESITTQQCKDCGRAAMVVLASGGNDNLWIVCHCGLGYVFRDGRLHPAVPPLDEPPGLSPEVAAAWREARDCLSVGAHIGAATLCRKILFHMAVEEGLQEKNAEGRAPGFEQCVNHLQEKGVITAHMRTWVDHIRNVGNQANHELTPVAKEDADRLGTFVHQLLRMHYGTQAALGAVAPPPPAAT